MKKKTKGIIMFIFFGGIMLTSGVVIGIPGILPEDQSVALTITGTPMDNFPDAQREQFCGTQEVAKSNFYVKEYKIPTPCTQPLAIISDPSGNLWFTQTNTGKIAKFDPLSETFTEYENPKWPKGTRSMMWGIDYSPDDSLWYTEEATDKIWQFSIMEKKYSSTDFPKVIDALPQRISIEGSKIIVNDFLGSKITLLDPAQSGEGISFLSIPSPVENSVTGSFTIDSEKNIWYTNWIFQTGGVLAKINQNKLEQSLTNKSNQETQLFELIDIYTFPPGMTTPNGIAADKNKKIWIADTSSSFFFKFDPDTESFTKYITSPPQISSYGNSSGLILNPVSRPYWASFDKSERLVFNEQTANRIGIFDSKNESLLEYNIPSKNPNWADCEGMENCGLAQVFDFTIVGDKIWFTEWVENNIGVIDTSKPLLFDVSLDRQKITLKKGEQTTMSISITTNENQTPPISLISTSTAPFSDLKIVPNSENSFTLGNNSPKNIEVTISASPNALPEIHKVLISAQSEDLVVSKYLTVIIEQ